MRLFGMNSRETSVFSGNAPEMIALYARGHDFCYVLLPCYTNPRNAHVSALKSSWLRSGIF